MRPRHITSIAVVSLLTAPACIHREKPDVTIIVPSDAAAAQRYEARGEIPSRRYVVRMSDGRRDWEIEFPEVATGYELAIPLEGGEPGMRVVDESQSLTAADKELLRKLRRERPDMEREGIFRGEGTWLDEVADEQRDRARGPLTPEPEERSVRDEAAPAPTRPSYLLGIDEVQRLFRGGQYEVAMVKLVELSRAYPSDVRLLAMKGSLWLRLGHPALAAAAWEEALRVDPRNKALIRALGALNAPSGGEME